MKNIITVAALSLACLFTPPSFATSFGQCLVDALSADERKSLARWVFFSMAVHDDIQKFASVSEEDRAASDLQVGSLVTRLLADDCPDAFREATSVDPLAVQRAFELVGQVAMGELMQDEKVLKAIGNYGNFVDMPSLELALGQY